MIPNLSAVTLPLLSEAEYKKMMQVEDLNYPKCSEAAFTDWENNEVVTMDDLLFREADDIYSYCEAIEGEL